MSLNKVCDYFRGYDKASYAAFTQQGAEPTKSDVSAVESLIGFGLPDEFRDYAIHPLGGLYMAVREELWPRPQAYHVGPFWSFLYGLMVYSFCSQAPDWLQLRNAWQRMAKDGHPELVPFLRIIGSADPYCFTSDGKIVVWKHETPNEPEHVSETFSEVLMREIHALEERKARKIRGEDKEPYKGPKIP
jgi:hypothetical protein